MRAEYTAGERGGTLPAIHTLDAAPSTEAMQRFWMGGAPAVFSVRWIGFLHVVDTGSYAFAVTSDDGAVVSIDGVPTIDNGGRHGLQTVNATVPLQAGPHSVVIDFTQFGGGFAFDWQWAPAGSSSQPVQPWLLSPAKASVNAVRAWHLVDLAVRGLLIVAALLLVPLAWLRRDWIAAHPRTSALVFFTLLAAVHTWPLATDLAHLTRHDNRDSILNEWIVGWVAHQLPRAPLHLFDGNIFHPERYTLAYSEPMVVQGVMAMPLRALGVPLVLTYNLLLLSGFALSAWAMAIVVRTWTRDWTAGLVAGAIFAFNAHSLSRIPHLQAQHLEFLPFALLAFDRVLEAPTSRNALKLAGWFILQSLTSVYLLVISAFALVAAALSRVTDLKRHPLFTLQALVIAGVVSVLVLTPFLLPYWFVSRDLGLVRSLGDAENFSAHWRAYLTTPARVHAWWSTGLADANVLFPGAVGLALALVAVVRGTAFTDRRARMCLALGLAGVALSFGAAMPGYAFLYSVMPLLRGIRATARFGMLATVAVAALAGFGTIALRSLMKPRGWRVVAPLLVAVASTESIAAPLGLVRFDGIPPVYRSVPRTPGTVVVEYPFFGARSVQFHAHYMLNSTDHWQPLVNGYSGFQPPSFYENAAVLQSFPGDEAFTRMRQLGVTHIVVNGGQMPPGTLETLATRSDLEQLDAFGAIVLFRIK